jgi:hypothetical protein
MPDARAAILAGTFHVFPCPGCGKANRVERELLYTDVDRGLFVGVYPAGEPGSWAAREEATAAVFDEAVAPTGEAGRAWAARFRIRMVLGLAALAEKLRLEDAGLDDRLIELIKLELLCEDDRLRATPGVDVIFHDATDERLRFALVTPGAAPSGLAVERVRYDELSADRPRLTEELPGLFAMPFVSYRRLASDDRR